MKKSFFPLQVLVLFTMCLGPHHNSLAQVKYKHDTIEAPESLIRDSSSFIHCFPPSVNSYYIIALSRENTI